MMKVKSSFFCVVKILNFLAETFVERRRKLSFSEHCCNLIIIGKASDNTHTQNVGTMQRFNWYRRPLSNPMTVFYSSSTSLFILSEQGHSNTADYNNRNNVMIILMGCSDSAASHTHTIWWRRQIAVSSLEKYWNKRSEIHSLCCAFTTALFLLFCFFFHWCLSLEVTHP